MQRFPTEVPLTRDAFRSSGWRDAIEGAEHGYVGRSSSLSRAAQAALDVPDKERAKVLWLLSDLCSMQLRPDDRSSPFKAGFELGDRRSALPQDFDEHMLSFLADVAPEIDDAWIRARVADLLWIRMNPRRAQDALMAIEAYISLPLTLEIWLEGAQQCWRRALHLCRSLGTVASRQVNEIRRALLEGFERSTSEEGFFALWLARMLRDHSLASEAAGSITQKLEAMAETFLHRSEWHRSREYFEEAGAWCLEEDGESQRMHQIRQLAEAWVAEAQACAASGSHMVAASHIESAIQTLRRIPKVLRATNDVDRRLSELHRLMLDYGERSLSELRTVDSDPIEIGDTVAQAREAVRGLPPLEALRALANIAASPDAEKARQGAEKLVLEHPLQSLFAASHLGPGGRVIARTPGAAFGESHPEVVWSQMVRNFSLQAAISVQALILPALETVSSEHCLQEGDFVALARQSPIVPNGHEALFGKGLRLGYDCDFAASVHLLAPQIENLVREHLKAAGLPTTTLGSDGIEQEKGLSALMDGPNAEKVFGRDLCFEFRALMCDPIGPNLRNAVAHGLLNDRSAKSLYSCYAWWLSLRLVFNAYWSMARKRDS